MTEYILPILVFLGFGALSGLLLLVASRVFTVEKDETAEKLTSVLPGANCGGCGFSGCEGYAAAIAEGKAPLNLCKPGGADTLNAVSEIMGVSAGEFVKEVAFVRCNGNCEATKDKYVYIGTSSCAAVGKFYNGKGACRFGCEGLGDCLDVCDNNAIRIENGVAVITPALCTGCGKCVSACPNNLIFLRKEKDRVALRCSSQDVGKATKAACKNGCIACRICEKKCPVGAIAVADNHAIIDYSKCTSCGACVSACPAKCLTLIPECN